MILSKESILENVQDNGLIENFSSDCLGYSSYKLRIGKIVIPQSGRVFTEKFNLRKLGKWEQFRLRIADLMTPNNVKTQIKNEINHCTGPFALKPRDILLFETEEMLKMPQNISGSYTAMNSIAQKGILLINASVVEPNYHGPLSGILANFSSKDFVIYPKMEIAKICFHQVDTEMPPSQNIENEISEKDYLKDLQRKAKDYYGDTFLDIKSILDDIELRYARQVRKNIWASGIIISILLVYATLEPFVYNKIWGRTSVSNRVEKNDYDRIDSLNSKILLMEKELQKIKCQGKKK